MTTLDFQSIRIENFKTFRGEHDFTLNRTPGLYYITGKNLVHPELGANGVGKSTIFDALLWVLWGRTGRDNRPADAIKPWTGKGSPLVQVCFSRNGELHYLERGRAPNYLKYWWQNGPLIQKPKDIEQHEVPKLLGMTEEMFRRTLVLGQFGTLFLDLKPEAQAQMFTEALDLDVWLRATTLAGEAAKAATRAAERADADIAATERSLATCTADIADYQEKADVFEQDKADRVRKGERGIAQLEADLAEAQAAAVERPALPDDTRSREFEAKLDAAKDAHEAARTALDNQKQTVADLKAKLDRRRKAKAPTCDECGQAIAKADYDAATKVLEQEYAAEDGKIKGLFAAFQHAREKAETAISVNANVQTAYREEKDSFDARMSAYENWTKKVASIGGELKRWRENMATVKAETNSAADQVTTLKRRRASLRAELTDLKDTQSNALAEAQAAQFWQDGFREIRLSIIDQTLVELEMATSRHAAMLGLNDWGVKFDTSRETKSGTVSHAFSVLLYPPGQDTPVKWESYSGGESQRWQIATAAALSEVLLSRAGLTPNIEVLDEPTKGLSGAGVTDLLEHLRDRALELGRAIFFVDHHSLDKGAFDGTLVVTKDKKGSTFKWQ